MLECVKRCTPVRFQLQTHAACHTGQRVATQDNSMLQNCAAYATRAVDGAAASRFVLLSAQRLWHTQLWPTTVPSQHSLTHSLWRRRRSADHRGEHTCALYRVYRCSVALRRTGSGDQRLQSRIAPAWSAALDQPRAPRSVPTARPRLVRAMAHCQRYSTTRCYRRSRAKTEQRKSQQNAKAASA